MILKKNLLAIGTKIEDGDQGYELKGRSEYEIFEN